MSQLIKVDKSGKTTTRELYEFLGLNQSNYAKWCNSNITENQFAEESKDWGLLVLEEEYLGRGQKATNYWLSIDFAKKLCMVSKSERGEQARNYFIEVEKRHIANTQPTVKLTPQPKYRARMISTAVKDVDATAKQIMKLFGVKDGIAQATALQMVESAYQVDMSPIRKLLPSAEHEIGRLTATDLAKQMGINFGSGNPNPQIVNRMLKGAGLMSATNNKKQPYELTVAGKEYGESIPYKNNGHSGYEIRWNPSVVELLTKIKDSIA